METGLRVGVVGVGFFGKYHAQIYSRMANVKLVAVADTDNNRAKSVARECGCYAATNASNLIEQVDAVSIAVPTINHLEVTRPFLENGIHVLLEKPIAATYDEGQELVSLAEKNNVILQIGHLERFNGGVRALLESIDDVQFVEVHRLGIFSRRSTDVDVIMDLMIHDIDIVLALIDSKIAKIDAVGIAVLTDHVDIANARLEFESGAVANITASRVSKKRFRRIRVFSQGSYYGLNYEDKEIEIVRKDDTGTNPFQLATKNRKLDVKSRPSLEVELFDFAQAIYRKTTPMIDGHAGLEALQVALQIKEKIALCSKNRTESRLLN